MKVLFHPFPIAKAMLLHCMSNHFLFLPCPVVLLPLSFRPSLFSFDAAAAIRAIAAAFRVVTVLHH